MKTQRKISSLTTAFTYSLCLLMSSCVSEMASGQVVRETRTLPSFNSVSLAFSGDIIIKQGNEQKIEIEGEKKYLDIIESEVRGEELILKNKEGHWENIGDINIYITIPEINKLSVSGSGDILCETNIATNNIALAISGSGSINIHQLEASTITTHITGSGNIRLEGKSKENGTLKSVITGSGELNSEGFQTDDAEITITGSGSARIHVLKELETNITGSGSVYYKGNPLVNANATGSGRTRSMN